MILDGYWKRELLHSKWSLKFWPKVSSISQFYSEHQINKAFLYSAMIMRKLFEDEKHAQTQINNIKMLPPLLTLPGYTAHIIVYPFCGDKDFIIEQVTSGNYDCKHAVVEEIALNNLCNQIIHSFVWSIVYNPKNHKIYGVAFASDKVKSEVLYFLELKEFIKVIDFCLENAHI